MFSFICWIIYNSVTVSIYNIVIVVLYKVYFFIVKIFYTSFYLICLFREFPHGYLIIFC